MSAMADVAAQRCHTDKIRPVECKQKARKGSTAHHEHVGAKSETGEATVTRDDVHGDHGGAKIVGDGVPATAVGKMTKQQGIKHHGIETKPKVHQSRATAHQRALAMEMRLRR